MNKETFDRLQKSTLAKWDDIEDLRINKNLNKKYFFLKKDITPEEQKNWFSSLLEKNDDFMFMCLDSDGKNKFGSIGFRILEEKIDFYNIMRFCPSKISMEDSLTELIEISLSLFPGKKVQVRVLEDNPAVQWYQKIGFKVQEKKNNFLVMNYN